MISQHEENLDLVDGMPATDIMAHGMPLTPFGKRSRKRYWDQYEETGKVYATLGAEAYMILLDAMNRCSDPADRGCLYQQIRSTANFSGTIGNITIGQNGKALRPLCIYAIEGGRSKFPLKVY
jgi:branched-chain amino acid transport system substrate-binding protein